MVAGGLVVAAGVEGELAEELAGGGVDDADVEVVDEQEDVGSGVGSADADVVQAAGMTQGDHAGVVDAVVADPVVGVGSRSAGAGFGAGGVGGGGGGAVRQGPVRAVVVVGGDEAVEQGLELGDGGRLDRLGGQPFLEGLLEAFDLAAGGRVVRAGVLLGDAQAAQFGSRSRCGRRVPPARRVVKTMPLSVSVEAGIAVAG